MLKQIWILLIGIIVTTTAAVAKATGRVALCDLNQSINWMPSNIESLQVTQVDVELIALSPLYVDNEEPQTSFSNVLFNGWLLPRTDWSKGLLIKSVIQGATNFVLPSDLGAADYRGGTIFRISEKSRITQTQFFARAKQFGKQSFIRGTRVYKITDKNHEKTFFTGLLPNNYVIWANDLKFLDTVISNTKSSHRLTVLGANAALLKHVDKSGQWWGFRNYHKLSSLQAQATFDRACVIDSNGDGYRDPTFTGITISLDRAGKEVSTSFMSTDKRAQRVREYWYLHPSNKSYPACSGANLMTKFLVVKETVSRYNDEYQTSLIRSLHGLLGYRVNI